MKRYAEICRPKFATPRTAGRPTFGPRLARVASALGTPMMPWQRLVADVAGEYDPVSGLPWYREIIVTVPRQSGKTTLFLAFQVDRCLNWSTMPHRPPPTQRTIYTAQTGKDARDKWVDELMPQLRTSALAPTIDKMGEGMGNEQIKFMTGGLIRIGSSSESSGHSKTLDQGVLDEIWHDQDFRREQATRPAMATREDAQLLICSTAGTAFSVVYNRKVAAGRAAVRAGETSGIAYFEWGAPDDGWDPHDDESWKTFMPAMCPDPPCECDPAGVWRHTITPRTVAAELRGMEEPEFIRAYGNLGTAGADTVIPEAAWLAIVGPDYRPSAPFRIGFEVAESRLVSSIAVKGANGTIEDVFYGPPDEGVDEVNRLCNKYDTQVAIDGRGPASSLAESIDRVYEMSSDEVAEACGNMYDAIGDQTIRVRTAERLTESVRGVAKRRVGDRFVWHRSGSASDPSPIWAATLAYACPEPERRVAPFAL